MNGVNTKLFNLAKLDINLTLGAARKKFGISATNSTDVPDVHACLNGFLPASFLVHLLETMNRGGATPTITPKEMHVFLHVLFLIHRHKCSATDLFNELKHGAHSLYGQHPELHGGDVIFSRCINGLSFNPNSEHRGLEWNESQTLDPTIDVAARGMPSQVMLCFLFNKFNTHIIKFNIH